MRKMPESAEGSFCNAIGLDDVGVGKEEEEEEEEKRGGLAIDREIWRHIEVDPECTLKVR